MLNLNYLRVPPNLFLLDFPLKVMLPVLSIAPYQKSQRGHPLPSQDNLIHCYLRTAFESKTFSITILHGLLLIFFIYSALEHLSP